MIRQRAYITGELVSMRSKKESPVIAELPETEATAPAPGVS